LRHTEGNVQTTVQSGIGSPSSRFRGFREDKKAREVIREK